MAWNGLSYTAAAELAGSARSGAAIGFQQTTLSVVGFLAAPLFAALVDASSWRAGFAVWAAAPLAGWWLLGQLAPEDRRDSGEGEARLVERRLTGSQPLKREPGGEKRSGRRQRRALHDAPELHREPEREQRDEHRCPERRRKGPQPVGDEPDGSTSATKFVPQRSEKRDGAASPSQVAESLPSSAAAIARCSAPWR